MKPFDYFAPTTVAEATDVLSRYDGQALPVAGGTDLLLKMKADQVAPRAVVNIKRIAELRGITAEGAANGHPPGVRVGALATLEQTLRSPVLREQFPALAAAAATMASVQIRNLATVGGNLCNAAPSADLAPILMALDAVARIAGPRGERSVPLEAFFTGPGTTVLAPGELLVALEIPPAAGPSLYLKHAPRACMDIAVVGVGLALRGYDPRSGQCQEARVVLGAVAPTPLRARLAEGALLGGALTPERIEGAAVLASQEARPIDDTRGSAWYRRRMVEVLTRRGLSSLAAN